MSVDRRAVFEGGSSWGAFRPGAVSRTLRSWASPLVRKGATRPIGRLLQCLFRLMHGRVVDTKLWGFRLRLVDDGNLSERRALFTEHRFDPGERLFLKTHIYPGEVFLDVGANAGLYSYWVASLGCGARILAFEPNPALAAQCRFNFVTNGIVGAELHACALGEEAGEATLSIEGGNIGQGAVGGSTGEGVRVEVRRLSDVLAESGVESVRCMKIDIEGHEAGVLRDLFFNAPARVWPESVVVETLHDGTGEVASLLGANGYAERARFRMNSVYARADS